MSGLARAGLVLLMFLLLISHRLLEERLEPEEAVAGVPAEEPLEDLPGTVETVPEAPADPPPEPRTYTVKQGETLSAIAFEVYGSHQAWHAIFDANRDLLDDPSQLQVGMRLQIPDQPR